MSLTHVGLVQKTLAAKTPEIDSSSSDDFSGEQLRLLCALINEAVRVLEEGVVDAPWMVDLGMVLGTGFAPFRGGPLRMVDTWGADRVVAHLQTLQRSFGERFAPCNRLRDMSRHGELFYPDAEREPAGRVADKSKVLHHAGGQ